MVAQQQAVTGQFHRQGRDERGEGAVPGDRHGQGGLVRVGRQHVVGVELGEYPSGGFPLRLGHAGQ